MPFGIMGKYILFHGDTMKRTISTVKKINSLMWLWITLEPVQQSVRSNAAKCKKLHSKV